MINFMWNSVIRFSISEFFALKVLNGWYSLLAGKTACQLPKYSHFSNEV